MERTALLGVGIFVVMGAFVLAGRSMLPSKTVEGTLLAQRELYPLETTRSLQQTQYDTSTGIILPGFTNVFQDVWEPVLSSDVPFFWDLPKAGTLTFQAIAAECLGLTSASSRGIPIGDTLIVNIRAADGGKYLNVDPSSVAGIQRMRSLSQQQSGGKLLDVYFSQLLAKSAELFSTSTKARLFTMMRHPVKQAIDMFYYEQRATWDGPDNYDFAQGYMSLAQFASSDKVVENFMVRSLAGVPDDDEVTTDHVTLAKEVLRRKFIVGIIEWFDLSVVRFEKYFGWWDEKEVWGDHIVNNCHFDKIANGDHRGNHIKFSSSDEPYTILSIRNWADIELYMYARYLFVDQADLIPSPIPK